MPLAFTRGRPRPRRWKTCPLCVPAGTLSDDAAGDRRARSTSAPKHELRVRDEHFGVEILAVALEARIVRDFEDHVDVAARTAARARVADAAQRHVLTRRDAGGNLHANLPVAAHASFATTLLARRAR